MLPAEPAFVVPESVKDALGEVAEGDAMVLAGGTSIGILLKNRLIEPEKLVWLGRIPGLNGIDAGKDGSVRFGAMTTVRELALSPLVGDRLPALAMAASHVGNPRVRSVATLGGALVHGDPRQDLPPVLLALGASATLQSAAETREVPLSEFFLGFMETACRENELVTEVNVPFASARRAHYSRFTPGSDDDYPTVGVAAAIDLGDDGTITGARVALGGVGSHAVLVTAADTILAGSRGGADRIEAVATAAAEAAEPTDDQRGSADYKTAMVKVWTRRTLERCLST